MQKLDNKKIDAVIKQLENAGKTAVKALNEMTEGSFNGSNLEKDPFGNLGYIVATLQMARRQAAANAEYEGLNEDEVTEKQAAQREMEKEDLQKLVQEKLAKRQEKEPEPETDAESTGEEQPDNGENPPA